MLCGFYKMTIIHWNWLNYGNLLKQQGDIKKITDIIL